MYGLKKDIYTIPHVFLDHACMSMLVSYILLLFQKKRHAICLCVMKYRSYRHAICLQLTHTKGYALCQSYTYNYVINNNYIHTLCTYNSYRHRHAICLCGILYNSYMHVICLQLTYSKSTCLL